MTSIRTPADLAAIRERAEKAENGPWERSAGPYYYNGPDQRPEYRLTSPLILIGTVIAHDDTAHDTIEFIAHSRTDIPALCSALEQAWERIRELEKAISEYLRASEYTPANPLTQDQWEALANTLVPARPVKE